MSQQEAGDEDVTEDAGAESYNPWTVVNVVFSHLAEQGLHPVLGDSGDPSAHADAMLRAFGIRPAAEGDARASQRIQDRLAELRAAMFDES